MELTLIPDEDPRLHTVCDAVENPLVTDLDIGSWFEVIESMYKLMDEKGGIGLAAPQVGISKRMFILGGQYVQWRVCFNPEIVKLKDKKTSTLAEGCLSYPGLLVPVKRPNTIKVRYQDESGKTLKRTLRSLDARAFQHELDHLNGIVIKDHMLHVRDIAAAYSGT